MRWARSALRHAASQGATQLLSFATGIVIVQQLAKTDYAFYSLSVAVIAATTVLADSGIGAAVMQRASQYATDRRRSNAIVDASRRFKRRLSVVFAITGAAWLFFLLSANSASPDQAGLIVALSVATILPTASATIFQILHRVHLNFRLLRATAFVVALVRLGMTLAAGAAGILTASTVLTIGLLCALGTYAILRQRARVLLAPSDEIEVSLPFRRTVSHVLPTVAALIATEQAVLAILSFRSTPEVIAEMAALSRFAIFFAILNSVVVDIASPLLARTPELLRPLVKRYTLVVGVYCFGVGALLALVTLTGPILLDILGPGYRGLEAPLAVFALGFGIANLAQVISVLNHSRGATQFSWAYIPLAAIWLLAATTIIDVADVGGASILFVSQTIPALITQLIVAFAYLARTARH